jgi:hypothetical protein
VEGVVRKHVHTIHDGLLSEIIALRKE